MINLSHLTREDEDRASSINEQCSDKALGIVFLLFISELHPPCICASYVAVATGSGLRRSNMINGHTNSFRGFTFSDYLNTPAW